MKCKVCGDKESVGNTKLCDSCRLKKWRKDNKEHIRIYNKMRKQRDAEKIKVQRIKGWNNFCFGGKKEDVLKRDNYTCQGCGLKKSDGKKLLVHHKDGKGYGTRKENKNNKMDNLITLCKECHMIIHNPQALRKVKGNFKTVNNNKAKGEKEC